MLRKILKIVGWIAGGIAGIVVLVYLTAIAVNWRDAEPSPAAVQLASLFRDRQAVADEDNGFVYLMGFEVAPHEDPGELGAQRVAWITGHGARPLLVARDQWSQRDAKVREFTEACRSGGADCVAAFQANRAALERWLDSERWLLQRYQALLAHAGWRETIPSPENMVFPSYAPALDGQRLLMVQAKLLADRGDYAGAQLLLESDLRFWRRVIASADMLISRMVAVSAVKRHFDLGNLVLRDLPPDAAPGVRPASWRDPISDSERSWQRCLAGEWEFTEAMMRWTESHSAGEGASVWSRIDDTLMSPLYRPQDSINKAAEYNERLAELLNAPLDRYQKVLGDVTQLAERTTSEAFPPRSLYNIVGELLVSMGKTDFGEYASRLADLEGVRRATLAAIALREAKVAPADVAAALATSELRNPYNDQPFAWDSQAGAIFFRGLAIGERGEHRIYY